MFSVIRSRAAVLARVGFRQTFTKPIADNERLTVNKNIIRTVKSGNVESIWTLFDACVLTMTTQHIATLLFQLAKYNKSVRHSHTVIIDDSRLKLLSKRIRACYGSFSAHGIGNALYGMQLLSCSNIHAADVIDSIATKIERTPLVMSAGEMSMAMYGLRNSSSSSPVVKKLLAALTTHFHYTANTDAVVTLDPQNVANMLYGLQNMTSDSEEVRQLLPILGAFVATCHEPLSAQAVGNALYGLRYMSSEHEQVRQLVAVLASKISTCEENLSAQAVCNAVYGLQNMSSDVEEVRDLLAVLVPRVKSCTDILAPKHVSMAIYGLQKMKCDADVVKKFLLVMSQLVDTCEESLTPQNIANVLYGMQSMESKHLEVRRLLSVVSSKITSCTQNWQSHEIGRAMYGLKGMSSKHMEVRDLLDALYVEINTCDEQLDPQALGNAFYGMQNMTNKHVEVRELVSILSKRVLGPPEDNMFAELHALEEQEGEGDEADNADNIDSNPAHEVVSAPSPTPTLPALQPPKRDASSITQPLPPLTAQNMGSALYGLQNMDCESTEITDLISVLVDRIQLSGSTVLDAQCIANVIFGLRYMSSDHACVRRLLEMLVFRINVSNKLSQSAFVLNETEVYSIILGFQSMRSEHVEVKHLLTIVTSILAHTLAVMCRDGSSQVQLDQTQLIKCIVLGLGNMCKSDTEVVKFVAVLQNFLSKQSAASTMGLSSSTNSSNTNSRVV